MSVGSSTFSSIIGLQLYCITICRSIFQAGWYDNWSIPSRIFVITLQLDAKYINKKTSLRLTLIRISRNDDTSWHSTREEKYWITGIKETFIKSCFSRCHISTEWKPPELWVSFYFSNSFANRSRSICSVRKQVVTKLDSKWRLNFITTNGYWYAAIRYNKLDGNEGIFSTSSLFIELWRT